MKRLIIVVALIVVGLFLVKGAPKSQTIQLDTIESELEQIVLNQLEKRLSSLRLGAMLSARLADAEPVVED